MCFWSFFNEDFNEILILSFILAVFGLFVVTERDEHK